MNLADINHVTRTPDLVAAFAFKVNKTDGCHVWTGTVDPAERALPGSWRPLESD